MIYADESSICKSAIHAGYLDDAKGGEFIIIIANGDDSYDSSY